MLKQLKISEKIGIKGNKVIKVCEARVRFDTTLLTAKITSLDQLCGFQCILKCLGIQLFLALREMCFFLSS